MYKRERERERNFGTETSNIRKHLVGNRKASFEMEAKTLTHFE